MKKLFKHAVILSENPYNVYKISMYYMPAGDKFTPCYCFSYTQDKLEVDDLVMINPVTGELT